MDTNLIEAKNELALKILGERSADVIYLAVDSFNEVKQLFDRPFEKIPGLPYTEEEQQACMLRAIDDYKNGRTITHEQLLNDMKSWF
jgi:hypothetical protein